MPNGDPMFFGLPCRFPARPSILVGRCAQVYDRTRFFGAGEFRKNFYPEFSRAAGKPKRQSYPAGFHAFGAAAARDRGCKCRLLGCCSCPPPLLPAHKRFGGATGVAEPNRATRALPHG